MDRQAVPSKSLRGRSSAIDQCPQGRRSVQRHRQHPHFYLNEMATQPTAVKILVDRKYAPVAVSAAERAKMGCAQYYHGWAYIDERPRSRPQRQPGTLRPRRRAGIEG